MLTFNPLPLKGAYVIEMNERSDDRGFFGRIFCQDTFKNEGLETTFVQSNNSLSHLKGTLRGMHYQLPPHEEVKLVRCIQGSIYDVILDIRPESTTFGQHYGVELSAENRKMMYVPRGFAHGFLTLEDESEVIYMVSNVYSPERERGIRWDDPAFSIEWPFEPIVVSKRDQSHPDFDPSYHLEKQLT